MSTTTPAKKGGILTYDLYKLFQQYIRNGCTSMPDINLLHDLVDGPVTTSAKRKRLRKKFKSWAARMDARQSDGRLVYKSTGKLIVPEEYFISAIKKKHCGSSNNSKHLNLTQTIEAVMEEYSVGKREFGIDKDLIVVVVNSCPDPLCQRAAQHRHNHKISQNSSGFNINAQPLQYKYLYHVQDQRVPNFPSYQQPKLPSSDKDETVNPVSNQIFEQIPSYLQDITATDKITKQIKNCSGLESDSYAATCTISQNSRNSLTKEQNLPHYSLATSTNVSWSTQAASWSHYCVHHNTFQEGMGAKSKQPSSFMVDNKSGPHLPSSMKMLSSCSGGSVKFDLSAAVPAQGYQDSFAPGTIPSLDPAKEENTALKKSLKALLGSHALSVADTGKSSSNNSIPNNIFDKLSSNFSRFPRIQPKPMTYSLAPTSNALHLAQSGNPYFSTSPLQFSSTPSCSGPVNFNTLPTAINSSSTIAKILEISKCGSGSKNLPLSSPASSSFPVGFPSAPSSSNGPNDSYHVNFKVPNAVVSQDKLEKFRIPLSPGTAKKPGSSLGVSKSDCHAMGVQQKCYAAYKKNFNSNSPIDLQKRNSIRALKQNHHRLRKNLKNNFLRRHMNGGRGLRIDGLYILLLRRLKLLGRNIRPAFATGCVRLQDSLKNYINDSLSLIHTLRSEIPSLDHHEEEKMDAELRLLRRHAKSAACDCC